MTNIELAKAHGAIFPEYGFDWHPGVAFTSHTDLDAYTDAVRADERAKLGVAAGWQLVPVKPSMEMVHAVLTLNRDDPEPRMLAVGREYWAADKIYRAMLAAAPQAPKPPAMVPLTDERKEEIFNNMSKKNNGIVLLKNYASAIEAAHGISTQGEAS
jgi:hypothetical protein